MSWNGETRREKDQHFVQISTKLDAIVDDVGEVKTNTAVNKAVLETQANWLKDLDGKVDKNGKAITEVQTTIQNTGRFAKWGIGGVGGIGLLGWFKEKIMAFFHGFTQ